ncbi:hypothetical protein ACFQ60_43450 [Streptomyces zhihengii]
MPAFRQETPCQQRSRARPRTPHRSRPLRIRSPPLATPSSAAPTGSRTAPDPSGAPTRPSAPVPLRAPARPSTRAPTRPDRALDACADTGPDRALDADHGMDLDVDLDVDLDRERDRAGDLGLLLDAEYGPHPARCRPAAAPGRRDAVLASLRRACRLGAPLTLKRCSPTPPAGPEPSLS